MAFENGDDEAKAFADKLGDLGDLQLEEIGDAEPPTEESFADARLDAPAGEPMRGGDNSQAFQPKDSPADAPEGMNLALVKDGAVVVSARDLARTQRDEDRPADQHEFLESRGATGVSAMSSSGPAPAGHKVRSRGLFAFDPVTNALAAASLALAVALAPAWFLANGYASSDEVSTAFTEMKTLRDQASSLSDPTRAGEGPQSVDAVTAGLSQVAAQIDEKAAAVDEVLSGASTRFWSVWLGLGLPLAAALMFLRRRPS